MAQRAAAACNTSYDTDAKHYPRTRYSSATGEPLQGYCAWCNVRIMVDGNAVVHKSISTTWCDVCQVHLCQGGDARRECFTLYHEYRDNNPTLSKDELPKFACGSLRCGACKNGPRGSRFPAGFSTTTGQLLKGRPPKRRKLDDREGQASVVAM